MRYRISVRKDENGLHPVEYNTSNILSSYYTLEKRRINDVKGYFVAFPELGPNETCPFAAVSLKELKAEFHDNDQVLDKFFKDTDNRYIGNIGLLLDEDFKIKGLSFDGNHGSTENRILAVIRKKDKVYPPKFEYEQIIEEKDWEFSNIILTELVIFGNITYMAGHWQADTVRTRLRKRIPNSQKEFFDIVICPLAESIFGDKYLKLKASDAQVYDPENVSNSAYHLIESWDKLERLCLLNFFIFVMTDYSSASEDLVYKEYFHGLSIFDMLRRCPDISDNLITLSFEGPGFKFEILGYLKKRLINS